MTKDARFEDGAADALKLAAETAEDLQVISTLCQDAVFAATEMEYSAKDRRFAILLNRFRWEDRTERPERVQSVLSFDAVTSVRSNGIDRKDADQVLSLLAVKVDTKETPTVTLYLAGDGAVELSCEVLSAALADVTRPYFAPSGRVPSHKV